MRIMQLDRQSTLFPPTDLALREPNGLLAIGGDLRPARLLTAYGAGIFPWFTPGDIILWWSPDPRAVLFPHELHISRSMAKFLRKHDFEVTINQAFADVIRECADQREEGTWIGEDVQQAYVKLHELGHAHSVEVWQEDRLVGGLYGVLQGSLFCGESMFSRATNASKTALIAFCEHFVSFGGTLIDCQVLNAHTESLGARNIPRSDYLHHLRIDQNKVINPACWKPQTIISREFAIKPHQNCP